MGISRKGGKRNRKFMRAIKRARYHKSFQARYGMTRAKWIEYKKTNPQEAHALRVKANA